ncbi:hypothetical protein SCLCIDRAFT_1211501 [Scleroderma citrinum Foug A]|uniref:Uncharacterized protein n=1 Tax=Scleroderma citrinum Foug A TaxID=1036808 RepID=A0A0C3ED63_9AGAM|nr:hypothetical protein SCLCIDRAFT_1211501 [Scleroderma citrinum Foug A]
MAVSISGSLADRHTKGKNTVNSERRFVSAETSFMHDLTITVPPICVITSKHQNGLMVAKQGAIRSPRIASFEVPGNTRNFSCHGNHYRAQSVIPAPLRRT